MAISSQRKHTRAHEELAAIFRAQGFPHVHCAHGRLTGESLPGIALTVTRSERLRLENAMAQAADRAHGGLPVLAHRTNLRPWSITMALPDFLTLYRGFLRSLPPEETSPLFLEKQ